MTSKSLKSIVKDIKALKIQGASNVRKKAVQAIKKSVQFSEKKDIHSFRKELKQNLFLILSARPTEPELRTAVRVILHKALHETDSVHALKDSIIDACNNYELHRANAMKAIAEFGAKKIPKNAKVLTHCHSSTVEQILKTAWKQKKLSSVICTETRPSFQGRITAKNLTDAGIPVTMIIDSAANVFVNKCDLFLTGCDAILADGSIVNKIGTAQISLAAKKADTPHFVATSSFAFDPLTVFGEEEKIEERNPKEIWNKKLRHLNIRNPIFDVTEKELIHEIITEKGVFAPETFTSLMCNQMKLDWQKEEMFDVFQLLKKLK